MSKARYYIEILGRNIIQLLSYKVKLKDKTGRVHTHWFSQIKINKMLDLIPFKLCIYVDYNEEKT